MKFSLTIHDLTEDQVDGVLTAIKAPTIQDVAKTTTQPEAPKVAPKIETPAAPAAAAVPPAPSGDTTEKEDEVEATTDGVELDANGLPWDERIHSGNKKKTSKGIWQRRRGVQDPQFNEIAAELKAGLSGESGQAQPEAPAAPATPPAPTGAPQAPVAPPAPATAPAAAPVAEAPIARDYQGFMRQIAKLAQNKQITQDYPPTVVQRVNEGYGADLKSITDISSDPRFVDYAWQCLDVDGHGV